MNFIPAEVNLEDDIAILLAAYGVFLEHRRYLLDMIYKDGLPPAIEAFDDYSHQFGVLMILVAVLLVALDLLFLALSTWGITFLSLKYLEISLLFLINLLAFAMLANYGRRAIKAYGEATPA